DRDAVPFELGSTLTVFGVTFTVVEGEPSAPNQVQADKRYKKQWENFYSALVAGKIETLNGLVPFIDHYDLSYGFYITITENSGKGTPP
ncbi:hypothetical protein, partial [Salmonella enterica]|uniref:hypothetical protein n=1 Tax=Salmonella enterica TaxID=28901 RepID=UPI003CF601BD